MRHPYLQSLLDMIEEQQHQTIDVEATTISVESIPAPKKRKKIEMPFARYNHLTDDWTVMQCTY